MKKLALALAIGLLAAVAVITTAMARESRGHAFHAHLNGYQEVPLSISTTGHGRLVIFNINRSAKTMEYRLQIRSLEGALSGTAPAGQAHLHLGQRRTNGGVFAFLCGGGDKPACSTSGTITGTIDAADILALPAQGLEAGNFEEALRAMKNRAVYANVHTDKYPSGEIRGQVVSGRLHGRGGGKGKGKDDE